MKIRFLVPLALLAGLRAQADVVTVDPVDYQPAGTVLTNVVPQFSLHDADSSNAESGTVINSNQEASGFALGPIWDFERGNIAFYNDNNRLRIDFNVHVTDVGIDYVSNSNTPLSGTLDVYDSSGDDLGEFVTTTLTTGQSAFMEVSGLSPNAAYAVAKAPDGSFARLTNLQVVTATPEPGTLLLCLMGVPACLVRNRHR